VFFAGVHASAWAEWASGAAEFMCPAMFEDLMGYCTSLLTMQRLESRHHLVSMAMAAARAMSVAQLSAALRRSINQDLKEASFRANLDSYLSRFVELVPEVWQTKRELLTYTTGSNLDVMFGDVTHEKALIASMAPEPEEQRHAETGMWMDHLRTSLTENCYYAMPCDGAAADGQFLVFQLLSLRPGHKRYIQRVACLATDAPSLAEPNICFGCANCFFP
jgi:hypothetical protein